jgi:hypothetical protein
MPLPPPLDFFAMQTQMDQQRRQREQDALQNMLMQDQQRERAAQQAIQMVEGGADKKKVFTVLGAELDEKGRALVEIVADRLKRDEKTKANTEASQPIQADLQKLAQGGGENTEAYARGISQLALMLGNEASTPIFEALTSQIQMAPTLSAMEQIKSQQAFATEFDQTGQIERRNAGIDVAKQSEITANRLGMERFAEQVNEADKAKTDLYADQLSNAYNRASEDPEGVTRALLAIQKEMKNPAIEMPPVHAKANAIWAASTDARGVADSFSQMGYQVPLSMAKAVSDGKAAIDEYTGLISLDPGKNGAQQRQSRASSMTLITQLKAVAQRMADGPMRGMSTADRLLWATAQAAKYEVGTADPLYTDYRNRKGPLSFSMARATFTGTMANQERQAMDKLFADPRMIAGGKAGRLNPQAESIFASLYANIESQYRVATPRGPFPNEKLREVLEARKQEDLDSFRSSYLDTQYPSAPDAQGWEAAN